MFPATCSHMWYVFPGDNLNLFHRYKPTCWCGYFHVILYDVCACNLCDVVKTEWCGQLIFASRKYELSTPFSFDNVTQITRANVIQNHAHLLIPCILSIFKKTMRTSMQWNLKYGAVIKLIVNTSVLVMVPNACTSL